MKVIMLLMSLFIVGCNSNPVTVTASPVDRVPLVVPAIDEYKHYEVRWVVVTPGNAVAVFDLLKKQGDDMVLFALTSDGYKNLSLNTSDQLKILRQHRNTVDAFKEYYLKKD